MARVFEGVFSIWADPGTPYDRRARLVFHADQAADMLYMRPEQDGRWTTSEMSWKLSDVIRQLFPRVSGTSAFFTQLFATEREAPDAAVVSFLRDASPLSGHVGGLPRFKLEMPGVSTIQYSKGCQDTSFSRIGGAAVDLSGVDFSGVHFRNVDFSEANIANTRFSHARFEGCRFGKAQLAGHQLDGANFSGERLEELDFTNAKLEGADLRGSWIASCTMNGAVCKNIKVDKTVFIMCSCIGTHFDGAKGSSLGFLAGDLTDATFDGAIIDGWYFPQAMLRNTSFKDAVLTGAVFTKLAEFYEAPIIQNIDLDNADLSGADFTDVSLINNIRHARLPRFGKSADKRTKLIRAKFKLSFLGKDASYIDATDATITYDISPETGIADFKANHAMFPKMMEFAGFRLPRADFSNARLPEARFGNAVLKDAKFNGAFLDGTDFSGAKLDGVVFNNAVVTSVNFTSVWLFEAKFEKTTLANTNFSSAMLVGVNFADLDGRSLAAVNFSNACLAQANFTAVTATRSGTAQTSFSGACLAGTIFTSANLADVVLTNAQVSSAKGKLVVEFPDRAAKEVEYDPTRIEPGNTGPQTICPDGRSGQCTIERLRFRPVKAKWPV